MERAFAVMLRAELTSASHNKLSALTQSGLKLGPQAVARVLSNHVRQCPIEALPAALQFADNLCRNAGPSFKPVFETELPELFELSWRRSDRAVRSQLLKLYVSWKSSLPQEVVTAIDAKMKTAKPSSTPSATPSKRQPEMQATTPLVTMKRAKQEPMHSALEKITPAPIPMHASTSQYWSKNRDPNVIYIDSGEEDSDGEERRDVELPIMSLVDLLMKAAEECKQTTPETPAPVTSLRPSTNLDFRNLHLYDEGVYKKLMEGSKGTKPRYLDWRFGLRFERRKQNCQSRAWYAHPEVWAQDSNPKDLSPQQLLQRLSKPRSWKTDDIMRVPIDDNHPQSHCAISGDLLEKSFDEKTGKWYYMHCRRLHRDDANENNVPDGAVCLIDCIKSTSFRG